MSGQAAQRLAIAGWLLTIGEAAAALLIMVVSDAPMLPNLFGVGHATAIAFGIMALAFSTAGVLVVSRLPRHIIGWLLLTTGIFYGVTITAEEITFAAAADATLGLGPARWSGWTAFLASIPGALAPMTIVLLFPDGRPPSAVFARVFRVLAIWEVALVTITAIQP
ncbi:MAG: hypothetical protein ABJC39_10300, partial [Chloroflexota bacterium]